MNAARQWWTRRRREGTASDWATRGALASLTLLAASCGYDASNACGAHQIYVTGGTFVDYALCLCDADHGYVFDVAKGYGCIKCGMGQVVEDDKCVVPTPDAGAGMPDAGSDPDSATPREPTGVGEPCGSEADCADYDAKYCETIQLHVCLVTDCAGGENACGSSAACCDYSALQAGFSICVPEEMLENDACPFGGKKVEP